MERRARRRAAGLVASAWLLLAGAACSSGTLTPAASCLKNSDCDEPQECVHFIVYGTGERIQQGSCMTPCGQDGHWYRRCGKGRQCTSIDHRSSDGPSTFFCYVE